MNDLRLALLIVNGTISTVGIFANLLLLVIIFVATPPPIRTYSVLIMNYAITDLFTSLAQALTVPRLVPDNNTILLIFYGGCSEIGYNSCICSFLVETFGLSHGLYSILLSICYRYFSLRYGVPKRKPIIILCFLTAFLSLVPLIIFWHKLAKESVVIEMIQKYHGDINLKNLTVAGIADSSDILVRCVLIYYVLPWIPIMITINVLKNRMYALVRSRANAFSSETLRLHGNLIKALTTQSLTPLLHLITYVCYVVEQHIYPNIITELIVFMPIGILSIVTPIINIYYIRPYREQFKRCIGCHSRFSENSRSKMSLGKK